MNHSISKTLMLAAIATTVACGDNAGPPPGDPDAPPAVPDAVPTPTVQVWTTPASVPRGESLTLNVAVTDFTFVDPTTDPPPRPRQGHFHIYFDDATDYGAGWASELTIQTSAEDSPGAHTVRVVLVSSVHVELAPLVEDTASFTLE